MQVDIFRAVGSRLIGANRIDRDAGKQAGRHQRATQVVDLAAVIEFARLEAADDLHMIRAERLLAPAGRDSTEGPARPHIDPQRIVAGDGCRVQQYVAFPHLGEGIAIFGQLHTDVGFGAFDRGSDDMIAGLKRQAVTSQAGRHGRRRVDDDFANLVALARRDRHHRLQPAFARLVERRERSRIIIAFRIQQPDRQRFILMRPCLHHGGGFGLAIAIDQRRRIAELILQPGLAEPFYVDGIADLRRLFIRAARRHLNRHRHAVQRGQRLG